MKKTFLFGSLFLTVIIFSYCHSAKKATSSTNMGPSKYHYQNDIKTILEQNCTPCHFPDKGGNKKAFDSYEAVAANIDSMINRVERNPEDKGFMPFKHPKLPDSVIAVFREWRDAGKQQ